MTAASNDAVLDRKLPGCLATSIRIPAPVNSCFKFETSTTISRQASQLNHNAATNLCPSNERSFTNAERRSNPRLNRLFQQKRLCFERKTENHLENQFGKIHKIPRCNLDFQRRFMSNPANGW
jgi:hypothetical protein